MTKFKLLGAVAALSTLIAAQAQAYGTEGREVAAPPWSAACMTDQGPSQCGEPMWVYGGGEHTRAFSSEVGTGSRKENASKQKAFSSESLSRTGSGMGTGTRKENASKQQARSSVPIQSERKRFSAEEAAF
jgi:hypothetical protein